MEKDVILEKMRANWPKDPSKIRMASIGRDNIEKLVRAAERAEKEAEETDKQEG